MVDLVLVGLIELAAGALLGWAVSAQHVMPDVLKKLGIRHPRRILQAHIDYIIMGVILIAVGLAVPTLSTWVAVVLVIGTIVNPALFFPLAFRAAAEKTWTYRVISTASFTCVSVSLVAAVLQYGA